MTGASVLIVDDSSTSRKLIIRALPGGWAGDVRQAGNGVEAIAAFREKRPDLMLLDLNMPEIDGYQVLEALTGEAALPVIIVISGDVQPKARERVMSLGARAFMKKPFSASELAVTLRDNGLL